MLHVCYKPNVACLFKYVHILFTYIQYLRSSRQKGLPCTYLAHYKLEIVGISCVSTFPHPTLVLMQGIAAVQLSGTACGCCLISRSHAAEDLHANLGHFVNANCQYPFAMPIFHADYAACLYLYSILGSLRHIDAS